MNGYVEAGYLVVLGTLGTYGATLVARERAARRRVGALSGVSSLDISAKTQDQAEAGQISVAGHHGDEDSDPGSGP
jgi:hypothetical protein